VNLMRKHLTVANVLSAIALFVALSGAAYAATTAAKNSVKASSIAKGAVTTAKLRNGAVAGAKLRNGAVTISKIATGAVGASQIGNGAVRSEQLGGSVVTSAKLKKGAVTGEKIANNSVGSTQLANNSVGASQLATNSVATAKIQEGAVSASKLASSVLASVVKNVVSVSKAHVSETAETETVVAECPSGRQAIAGGAKIVGGGPNIALTESTPVVVGGKLTGWQVGASAVNPPLTWAVEATAICAEF
jgi:hypothetical protein